jgi:NADPH:quinone reductase-like Zn-dependent oxidoreductase
MGVRCRSAPPEKSLKRVVCTHASPDPARGVAVVEAPEPVCPDAGVVVALRARPINPADLLLIQGRHVFTPEYPAAVGIEGAGHVLRAGPRSRHAVGRLVAVPYGGTWCERVALDDDDVLPLPATLSIEQAAMLSVNPFTAAGLLEGVPRGACVALDAANSAVSRLVLELCRARGIAALCVVRPGVDAQPLLERGAHAVVEDGPGLPRALREAAPGPITRALDAVAGDTSGRLFEALSDGGELIVYGLLSDDQVRLPAAQVVFRPITVRGYSRLRALAALSPERRAALTDELVALVAQGALATPVESRYPLEQVAEALAHYDRGSRGGKLLLVS